MTGTKYQYDVVGQTYVRNKRPANNPGVVDEEMESAQYNDQINKEKAIEAQIRAKQAAQPQPQPQYTQQQHQPQSQPQYTQQQHQPQPQPIRHEPLKKSTIKLDEIKKELNAQAKSNDITIPDHLQEIRAFSIGLIKQFMDAVKENPNASYELIKSELTALLKVLPDITALVILGQELYSGADYGVASEAVKKHKNREERRRK